MHKKLTLFTLGLILATTSFSCDAAKLTKAQLEEIYNTGSTTASVSSNGTNVETRVSTKRIIKPNISTKTTSSPKPKVESNTTQPTAASQQQVVKNQVVTKPAPPTKPVVVTNPSTSTNLATKVEAKKEAPKPKVVKAGKAKKQAVKTTNHENKATTSTWKVKVAQKNLRILGLSNEPPTGKMTATTKEALITFQKKYKLTAKGELTDETYNKLNWEVFAKTGIKNIKGSDVVAKAAKYRGVPYVFGGTTPKGFDCSGYVQYVFKELGGNLTRTADTQAEEGVFVNQKQLKPGDLVFFTTYEPGASHVGIYAGNGQFWNASSSRGVVLYKLSDDYWRTRYYGARRVLISNGEIN